MSQRVINLEILCLMHGFRPSDLANALRVSRSLVSLWFNGTRGLSLDRAQQIATLLEESRDEVCQAYNVNALPQLLLSPHESAGVDANRIHETSTAVA